MRAEDVSAVLFDEDAAVPVCWIRDDDSPRWHRPGLISAWVDDRGRWELEERLGQPMDSPLLRWWGAPATHEDGDAISWSLWGQADRLLDRYAVSVLRIWLGGAIGHAAQSMMLADWVAAHVLVVPVPVTTADVEELVRRVQPPVPALFQVTGRPTSAQTRLLTMRAVSQQRRRARLAHGRRIAAAVRATAPDHRS